MFVNTLRPSLSRLLMASWRVFPQIEQGSVNSIFTNTMTETIEVEGYEKFKTLLEGIDEDKQINIYFEGSKDEKGGSWCPDCVSARPLIADALDKYASKESVFIFVDVGGRDYWKDMKNSFRTDKDLSIKVIPTLIRWKSYERLEGEQCEKLDLLKMFFMEGVEE